MYVERSSDGDIVGVYTSLQAGYAEEFLQEDSAEIDEFFKKLEASNG